MLCKARAISITIDEKQKKQVKPVPVTKSASYIYPRRFPRSIPHESMDSSGIRMYEVSFESPRNA